jgi:hypothetical protein
MLCVLTPTRARPYAFSLLERYLQNQTFTEPWLWIVVCDGGIEDYRFTCGQQVYRRTPRINEGVSLPCNLAFAESMIPESCERILVCEDDDYYAPEYLASMTGLLEQADLAGESIHRRLYWPVSRRARMASNPGVASLCQTGFTRAVLPTFRAVCRDDSNWAVDIRLWRAWQGSKIFGQGGNHVGIKGMPGTPNASVNADCPGPPDLGLKTFGDWGLPDIYLTLYRNYTPDLDALIAPMSTGDCQPAYRGRVAKKPWDHKITAVIPHLNTLSSVKLVIGLLRLQTEQPYILVIDTGSTADQVEALEAMRGPDLEIHYIRGHAWRLSSEPVMAAMDSAFGLCRTEFLYCTHADCFPRRRDLLAWLLGQCGPDQPAVGYEMSERSWITDEWKGMLSHTASMLHMPTMLKAHVGWQAGLYPVLTGRPPLPDKDTGWPDTETNMNLAMQAAGIKPLLLGPECNYCRQTDQNIDHVRSSTLIHLYGAGTRVDQAMHAGWLFAAMADAQDRIDQWTNDQILS